MAKKGSKRKCKCVCEPVRFGVVGVGGMGQGHTNTMQRIEEAELAAVCDIQKKTAQQVGEKFGVPWYVDYRELIDSGKVEAVIVATPHYFHPPVTMYAAKRGVHVISEKPIGDSITPAEKAVKAARESGIIFSAMFQQRTTAAVKKALEIIQSGELGEMYRSLLIASGFRSQAYYDSGEWRATWKGEGGGVLVNQAPHPIDVFCKLAGMPCEVYARTRSRIHNIECEDEAEALLTYSNGAHGYLYVSTDEVPGTNLVEICCERGKLVLSGGLNVVRVEPGIEAFCKGSTEMWGGPKGEPVELELEEGERGHGAVIRNVARAIRGQEELLVDGADGLMSLELANAIILSGQRQKPVEVPLSRPGYERFINALRATTKPKRKLRRQTVTDPKHIKKGKKGKRGKK